MTILRGLWVLLGCALVLACGGGSFTSAPDDGSGADPAIAGSSGMRGREDFGGSSGGGASSTTGGTATGGSSAAGTGPAGGPATGGTSGTATGGSSSSAGTSGVAGAGVAGAGGTSSAAGTGGTSAAAGTGNVAGAAGGPPSGPKRITIIGIFGGQNALGSTQTPPTNGMYAWPDSRIREWTEYSDGAPLGPTASGEDSTLVTSGAELQIGSDAKISMPDVGMVAIVKYCRTKTLISDWTKSADVLPWFANYASTLEQVASELRAKYPSSAIKFAHVYMLGEYDAQTVANVDKLTLATTIRTLNANLIARFPGSFVVATEPNLAISSWWPQNTNVRAAYEAIGETTFSLVNTDAIPPANASAHDPAFDVGQELNVGSRLEYAIERQIEKQWGAP